MPWAFSKNMNFKLSTNIQQRGVFLWVEGTEVRNGLRMTEENMTSKPGKCIPNTYNEKTKSLKIGSLRCWEKHEQICWLE